MNEKGKVQVGGKLPEGVFRVAKSNYLWIGYPDPSAPNNYRRHSAKTADPAEAKRLRLIKMAEVASGKITGPENIKVAALLNLVTKDYARREHRSQHTLAQRLRIHVQPYFGDMRAAEIGTRQIQAYQDLRVGQGAKNATVNKELAIMRRAFSIGLREQDPPLVTKLLAYKELPECNVRQGMYTPKDYQTLRLHLPEPYRTLCVIAYHVGLRKGELLHIEWDLVELGGPDKGGTIRLRQYTTKNGEPRVVPIYGDMEYFIRKAKEERDSRFPNCKYLVHDSTGVKPFCFDMKKWNKMLKALELKPLTLHDFRRVAITNMINAGIPPKIVMLISGHKTQSMLDRYHISNSEVVDQVGVQLDARFRRTHSILSDIPAQQALAKSE